MVRERTSYMAHRNGEPPAADDPLLGFAPAPHTRPRRNSITAAKQRAFVAHLAATGIVAEAARHIGASLEALYKLRHKPGAEGFAAAWDEAVERGVLRIEHGALQRAIEGVERPIVSGGKLLGYHRVHHEGLVMFLLRQRRPERYGATIQLALKPGHPLYERIRSEVLCYAEEDEQATLDSIDKFIDDIRERRAANTEIVAEMERDRLGYWGEDDDDYGEDRTGDGLGDRAGDAGAGDSQDPTAS
jgi:hypothetical protein